MFHKSLIPILFGLLFIPAIFASDLLEGFYIDSDKKVEVILKDDGDKITVIFDNGDEEFYSYKN